MVGRAALRALRRREGGNVPAAAAALLSRRGVPGARASPANTVFLSATSPRKGLGRMLCSGSGGGGGGAGAGEKNTGARVVQKALRHREGGNVPAAASAAALLTRRGVPMPGGQAPPATIAFLSSTSPSPRNGVARMLCSGRDGAGAGAGVENTGARVVQPGAGGASGGRLGAGVPATSAACNCAKKLVVQPGSGGASGGNGGAGGGLVAGAAATSEEVARLRDETMVEIHKLWGSSTTLMQQNNDMAKEFPELRIQSVANRINGDTAVVKLGFHIVLTGICSAFVMVNIVWPYVKKQWQGETVDLVMAELDKLEKKKKAAEKEELKGDSDATVSSMQKTVRVPKPNDGASDEVPPKKR